MRAQLLQIPRKIACFLKNFFINIWYSVVILGYEKIKDLSEDVVPSIYMRRLSLVLALSFLPQFQKFRWECLIRIPRFHFHIYASYMKFRYHEAVSERCPANLGWENAMLHKYLYLELDVEVQDIRDSSLWEGMSTYNKGTTIF